MILFKNANVFPIESAPYKGDVRISERKITGMGIDLDPLENEEVIDLSLIHISEPTRRS